MINIYAPTASDDLSAIELELYNLIMDYRAQNGLAAIPLSKALTTTAGRHAIDTYENIWAADVTLPAGANLHSWSDAPYFADHSQPQVMWDAPERLGTGYTSNGYEISASGYADVTAALAGWKVSSGHNSVILNQGIWAGRTWTSIGIGVEQGPEGKIYHVWFGDAQDPTGAPRIVGGAAADNLLGTQFDDNFFGMGGNDTIDGRGGSDTVTFSGKKSDYKIVVNGNTATLEDLRAGSPDGLDTIRNMELVKFSDISVAYSALTNQGPAVNQAPTVAVADKTLAANQTVNIGTVSYSDPENNAATQYQIVDNGTAANGAALIGPNGAVVTAGTTLTVSAADLANVSLRGGSAAGTESFQIRAFDGTNWSGWDLFNITTTAPAVNQAPVATINDRSLNVNQWVKVADLLSYSDAENNPAVQYQFIDLYTANGSAYFWNNGTVPTANQVFTVNAADLGNLWVRGAQAGGWENMQVRASDGASWGAWDTFKITTLPNNAPVATINDKIVRPNATVNVTDLLKYTDANGDAAVQYQFIDLFNGTGSAHFLNDGQVMTANQAFTVNAADLSKIAVRGASAGGWDNMQVRAHDGKEWGAWDSFKFTTNAAAVATIDNKSVSKNEWVQASTLLKTTDAEGDAITEYQFIDKFDASGSAFFWYNGQKTANQTFTVKASDLANVWIRGGEGPGWDKMQVRANDGNGWGAWDAFKFTTLDNSLPVVSAGDVNLRIGQKVAASSLFSVTDPDIGDVITKYQIFDDNALANSGRFFLGTNVLAADTTHTVSADNLSRLSFTGGSAAGSDLLWVRAFDGDGWSAWHQFNANTIV